MALAAASDGVLLERSTCVCGIENYASKMEYENALGDDRFTCQKLTYSSDGLPVIAYAYYRSSATDRKQPTIIFNRGGYTVNNQLPPLIAMMHRLASEGFAVIAPMYRGSEGAPGHDEVGGADLADLKNVLPLAKNLAFADVDNLFLYGESRGGVMTFLAIRDGFPARAAATFGGFTDLAAYLHDDPRANQLVHSIWPDYDDSFCSSHSAKHSGIDFGAVLNERFIKIVLSCASPAIGD